MRSVIRSGEVIAEYPADVPFPSYLILGFPEGLSLHVVVAADHSTETCYVVTVYVPDPAVWHTDFKTRKGA